MRRTPRKLSLQQCYDILDLDKDADLEALKHAYRRRAFELHPDLNPGRKDANRKFQLLNEAYVALSAILGAKEAKSTEKKAQPSDAKDAKQTANKQDKQAEQPSGQKAYAEEDVLRDLLNDPFARRVFEDIYSELNKQQAEKKQASPPPPPPDDPIIQKNEQTNNAPPPPKKEKEPEKRGEKKIQRIPVMPENTNNPIDKGVGGAVKNWLRRQIDEEQRLFIPTTNLRPGNRLRLQIRQGLGGEVKTVEVTIPPDFVPGKAIRLRGLGKKVGPWQGDLYLILNNKID